MDSHEERQGSSKEPDARKDHELDEWCKQQEDEGWSVGFDVQLDGVGIDAYDARDESSSEDEGCCQQNEAHDNRQNYVRINSESPADTDIEVDKGSTSGDVSSSDEEMDKVNAQNLSPSPRRSQRRVPDEKAEAKIIGESRPSDEQQGPVPVEPIIDEEEAGRMEACRLAMKGFELKPPPGWEAVDEAKLLHATKEMIQINKKKELASSK